MINENMRHESGYYLDNYLDVRFATESQDYLSRLQIQSDVDITLSEAHAVSVAPRRAAVASDALYSHTA